MTEIYYRLVDSKDGQNRPTISLIKYQVVKRTEKGAWIVPVVWYFTEPPKRFVLDGDGKRFAYPSFEQARTSYQRRKSMQIRLTRLTLERATERAEIAKNLTEAMTENVYRQHDDLPPSLQMGRIIRDLR